MSLMLRCPVDGASFRVLPEMVGARVRHECGTLVEIPLFLAATEGDKSAAIARSWQVLMELAQAANTGRTEALQRLINAYLEPGRYYHNRDHIVRMLDSLPLHQSVNHADRVPELKLAAWYHDAVYDTRKADNEVRSAELARESLVRLGIRDPIVARVVDLILMTRHHTVADEDSEALVFLDADLSILQAPPNEYAKYASAIREEYAWLPDREFYNGRRQILQRFLDRPRIFRSDRFCQGESIARANLAAEIAQIDQIVRTL